MLDRAQVHGDIDLLFDEAAMVTHPFAGHADAKARRSVLTALQCANLVTVQPGAWGHRLAVR